MGLDEIVVVDGVSNGISVPDEFAILTVLGAVGWILLRIVWKPFPLSIISPVHEESRNLIVPGYKIRSINWGLVFSPIFWGAPSCPSQSINLDGNILST